MNETGYFTANGAQLFYVCEQPTKIDQRIGILFVHAADASRLGPHRLFVEAARRYRNLGYPTFRFDLRGCGDSYGRQAESGLPEDVEDVRAGIRYFQSRADLEGVILFGISRGSLIAFLCNVQDDLPVKGMILLSPPVSSGKAALRSFSHAVKEYSYKLMDRQTLGRLFRGQIQFRRIVGTFLKAVTTKRRYSGTVNQAAPLRCPVLLIYGGKDPIASDSMAYYLGRCRQSRQPCECRVIQEANHSFFHYRWKQEVLDLSEHWLSQLFSRGSHA